MLAGKADRGRSDDGLGRPIPGSVRNIGFLRESKLRQVRKESWNMELTFVAKDPDSVPDGSPALYRSDRGSWIVQGWAVTDPAALAALNLLEGETCVEIPGRLIRYFQTRT
jgi:hypothetical protein